MRRAAARVAAGVALWCAASCLNIEDVVQPAEVEAGKKFEVEVGLRSFAGLQDVEKLNFAGVVAVSIPGGAEVIEAKYEGAAKGRLDEHASVGAGDLPERSGYKWVYFVTPKTYDPVEYVGKDYVVTLTLRAPDAPGDYDLCYAAGAVTAEGPNVNYDTVYWGMPWQGEGREPMLELGITVK